MMDLNLRRYCSLCIRQTTAHSHLRLWTVGLISTLAMLISGCGGGGSSSSTSTTRNPIPSLSSIAPTTAPAGSRALTLTVTGSNFISGSIVRWNGLDRTTTYRSGNQLAAQITPADLAGAGVSLVTVFNPTPGGGTSGSVSFAIRSVDNLSLLTARLPDAATNKEYSYTLQASGGITPYTWTLAAGSLPTGLSLSTSGEISGTVDAASAGTTYTITVQVSDDSYQARTLTKTLGIRARSGNLGRNDVCANATPASDGVIRASISPFGDVDVYSFQGTAGNRISAEIYAQRLTIYEDSETTDVFLDPFLEILDSNCTTLYYNDDISTGVIWDSLIANFTLQNTGTYYLRISDLRGDGRPDFIYDLHLTGAD